MGYTVVTTVYEGAEESCFMYLDDVPQMQEEMKNSIETTKLFAKDNSDAQVQIYKLHHDHDINLDCECIQYVTDHNPYWSSKP